MAVLDALTTLTSQQARDLLESPDLVVDCGLELLNSQSQLIKDISDIFIVEGSSITWDIDKELKTSGVITVTEELEWGKHQVRIYMLISNDGGVTQYRWDVGTYLMTTPERVAPNDPIVWEVDIYDRLDILNTPHGTVYNLYYGDNVTDAVGALIQFEGQDRFHIPPLMTTSEIDSFSRDANSTTLKIANDLLETIGYKDLWTDPRSGAYLSAPHVEPDQLAPMWTYDATSPTTMVSESRVLINDYYSTANYVIGYNDDVLFDQPDIGDGIYIAINQGVGPSSVIGRGGRYIRQVVRGTFQDQAALEVEVNKILHENRRLVKEVQIAVSPNPYHGHYDVVTYTDPDLNINGLNFLVAEWTLPLDGTDMELVLREV